MTAGSQPHLDLAWEEGGGAKGSAPQTPWQLRASPWCLPVVTVCIDTSRRWDGVRMERHRLQSARARVPQVPADASLGGGTKEGLTQAKAELSGREEACVGLVQTFEHSL